MMSVNTNVGAMLALQNLNKTNVSLDQSQLRISTGLRVNSARDDASSYSISQKMKSDVAGYEAVKIGLGLADAAVGVATKAGEAIQELLIEMKAKSVQAQGGGLATADRQALHNDAQKLIEQVNTIVSSAVFNDVNLISAGSTDLTVLSSVDGSQTITLSAHNMSPADIGTGGTTLSGGATVALDAIDLTTSANAALALATIDTAISSVLTSLAGLGSVSKQIDVQVEFTNNLIDILNTGVGVMVDADMAKESASLQALQIKQQLGTQALGIANAAPQSILGLFNG